jgi:eukaryotic-like serine/threonine-protein kinase
MTEAAKQWEGQVVEGIFPLRQFLGGSDHSAVFLTDYNEGEPQKAVIKLFPADPATADLQISSWESAAQLSHPNLLRLLGGGRCRLEGNDLQYLVMEYAEEDLSQILPQRALTPEEVRDMLGPVLDALEHLHGKGFVHGDLKPANILASGDRLKLSSDAISRIGEASSTARRAGAYDPPEAIAGKLTSAADIWSLGTTLVEVLTQHLPEWQPGPNREPVVPTNIPAPFQEIARECLRLEPERRISVAEIGARLNARAASATAAASASLATSTPSVSPVTVAAGQIYLPATPPNKPTATLPVIPRGLARMQSSTQRPTPDKASGGRPRFLVPLIAGALLFAAVLTVPRLFRHRTDAQPVLSVATSGKTASKPAAPKAAGSSAPSGSSKARPNFAETAVSEKAKSLPPALAKPDAGIGQPAAHESLKSASEKEQPPSSASPVTPAAATEAPKAGTIVAGSSKGEVLDQVLPDVSEKARATIHGKVRVSVKVHVDPAGGVSGAEFDSPGPSQFFADLALKAARKWAFTPPEVNGKSVTSEWRLRFEFTPKGTQVAPTQIAPL